ncbi:hypothetical protein [Streptomyces sp. NPDC001450]
MNPYAVKALTACSTGTGSLHVFVGVDDGSVWHTTLDGSWGPWSPLGRPDSVSTVPDGDWLSATASGSGDLELLVLGGGGELWYRRLSNGSWAPWSLYGSLTARPPVAAFTAVAADAEAVNVFFVEGDGTPDVVRWHPQRGTTRLCTVPRAVGRIRAVRLPADRVELLASSAEHDALLRGDYEPGRPVRWQELEGFPEADSPCCGHSGPGALSFTATERDLFAAGPTELWHRALDGPRQGWETMGGDLTARDGRQVPVAAVASADGRTDVFALWAGTALVHRCFDRIWSDWELVGLWDDAPGVHTTLRPEDLVSLTVRSSGLQEHVRADGVTELVPGASGGRLVVEFPPQHMAESVLGTDTSSQARLAGASRLHFAVDQHPIALTTDGLLDAMARLPLIVGEGSAGQEATRLELPWRLVLALRSPARCAHRSRPATSTGGITELWHSRISASGGDGQLTVQPREALPGDSTLDTPLGQWVGPIAAAGVAHPDTPVAVDRLMLSAYGAWFSACVHWPELDWTHRAVMGRDSYVEILKTGALFPFGHRAAYVQVSERQFDQHDPAVAGLRRRNMLIVTEPTRTYGIGAGGPHERRFPFQVVTVEPRELTELDEPCWQSGLGFWPTHAGSPVHFLLRAQAGDEPVTLSMPLLFVPDSACGTASAPALDALYARGPAVAERHDSVRPSVYVGRRLPLAMQSATAALPGAVQEVESMTFGGTGIAVSPNGVGFHPQVTQMQVGLPAVRQLLGALPSVPAAYSAAFVSAPSGGTLPDALLDLLQPQVLNFAAAGPRTGLLAAPNATVNQIARAAGPVFRGTPTPQQLFDADAKLFGVVALRDIVARITMQPQLSWVQDGSRPSATLNWQEHLSNKVPPLYPNPGSLVKLTVDSRLVQGHPDVTTQGTVTDFTLIVPEDGPAALVRLAFRSVDFSARTGSSLALRFDLADAQLTGKLGFLHTLAQPIQQALSGGPQVDVSPAAVRASYRIAVPSIGVLVFAVQNLLIESDLTVPLTGAPVTFDFAFGTRERPFLVTVSGFGGGGYLELGVSAGAPGKGLRRFVGGIEFGASLSMDFGIARGEVHAFGGVVCVKRDDGEIEVTGYLRVGGSVRVLGLVGVSVELMVSLSYDFQTNVLSGTAQVVITVDLTFWSTSVTLTCHKTFTASHTAALDTAAGGPPDGSVAAALGPDGHSYPWQIYCQAFARV